MAAVRKSDSRLSDATAGHHRLRLGWWLIGLGLAAMVLLWMGGDSVQTALRYDRMLVIHGEYWRLFTGHWVHGSLRHMALNAAGALIIAFLFTRTYAVKYWLWILAISLIAIDIGFLALEPQLQWYVGASGVLHGALAAGVVAWWRMESRGMALALSAIVVGKLSWEHWHGALPLAGEMPVIVDAHLYGAIGGAVASAMIELLGVYSQRRRDRAPL